MPVVEITAERYAEIRGRHLPGARHRLPAVRRRASTITSGLDAHLVGTTGPITAELLTELGTPYGRDVGRGSSRHRGPVRAAARGHTRRDDPTGRGRAMSPWPRWPSSPPAPGIRVQTTIDPDGAAGRRGRDVRRGGRSRDRGGAGVDRRGARDGERAESNGYDIALRGQYPPGSTFKIVTTAALLENGLTPDSVLACPATVTVNGRTFRNYEGEAAGSLSLADAVATSCNNAFINGVDGMALRRVARDRRRSSGWASTRRSAWLRSAGRYPARCRPTSRPQPRSARPR